jgi:predicted GIY-YIG superfamily endonuclease
MHLYWIRHPDHTDIFRHGYVGVSSNPKRRWREHNTYKQNNHLKNAINMYGWASLIKETVLIGDKDYCLDIESKLRPADKIGWNIVKGGGLPPSATGKKFGAMPEATKIKLRIAKKGCKPTRLGAVTPPEVRARISQTLKGNIPWNKGKKADPEAIERLRQFNLGRPSPRKGVKLSAETIEKIRAANTGKKQNPEWIEKARLKKLGKKQPLVTCPHCNKIGGSYTMPRWHFERCKFKEIQPCQA